MTGMPEGFKQLLEKLSSAPPDKLQERLLWMSCAEIMEGVHAPTCTELEEEQERENQSAAQKELMAFVNGKQWSGSFAIQVLCLTAQAQLLGLVSRFRPQQIESGMRTVSLKKKLE